VIVTLVLSTLATGSLVGFLLGMALSWVGVLLDARVSSVIATLVGLGLAADALRVITGRPRPWSVNRQVPQAWSSLFPATTTAGLYGARLGVGPLTMLSTWLWWSSSIAGAVIGVGTSVAIGAAFSATRALTTVGASLWAEGPTHQARFNHLRSLQQPGRYGLAALGLLSVVLFSSCSTGQRPELTQAPSSLAPTQAEPTVAGRQVDAADETQEIPPVTEPAPTRITPTSEASTHNDAADSTPSNSSTSEPATSVPATSVPATSVPATSEPETGAAAASPDASDNPLEAALLVSIPGFETIADPGADRRLDIDAAANIQPDPTEELPLLETRGFVGGWTRAFRNDQRDVVVATVYQFANHTEAAFYLEDGLITIGGYGGQFFEVPDIVGSRGFRQEIDGDEPLLSVGITFVRDRRWFLVYLIGDADGLDPERLIEAARRQDQQLN
jgi:hypothetical protein